VKAPALAEAAVDLPWLAPCADSLAALVRLPADKAWAAVRGDPGLVLLWARCAAAPASSPSFAPHSLHDPRLLEKALRLLEQPAFVDWSAPDLVPIYQTCCLQATLAHLLAGHVDGCNPECAWMGGLLAPLGWLAACAVDPAAVKLCRGHADFVRSLAAAQQHCWGLDHTAIARRLCRRWGLPPWLAAIIGQLGLPAGIAQTLGADARLLQVVQLAVGLVQQENSGLGLVTGSTPGDLVCTLGLTDDIVEKCLYESKHAVGKSPAIPWSSPANAPLLGDYLRLAHAQLGHADAQVMERLQSEVDRLHHALQEQCAGEAERLGDLKLRALAELAAGAGHEINNPLAVISGQAQYLMTREADPARCKALQAIVGQTRRIHQILTDLMQFARPAPPEKEFVEVNEFVRDVIATLQAQAEQAQVQLICPEPPVVPGRLHVDLDQVAAALGALLRNGIEAAPAEGWVILRVLAEVDAVDLIVEDNGAGPSASAREHLFDPFFSGKSAGRGRGLGLTTAWRLAQLNGGNIRFDGHTQSVTRFTLRLPLVEAPQETVLPQLAPVNGQLLVASCH